MKLNLYTFFHLNMFYSSIPERKRSAVIERCYWPILHLIEKMHVPIGIEISGGSLEVVKRLDPSFVQKFKALLHTGRCELIGSGYMQIIGPLAPAGVNHHNQQFGIETYQEILRKKPKIALISEQAFSSGLITHYKKAGYKALIMEWNNPYKYHPEWDGEKRYYSQYVSDAHGKKISLIWNNAINFQKFQRYVHNENTLREYLDFIKSNIGKNERCFPLYGNDAEIFDFRPGRFAAEPPLKKNADWARIGTLFEALKKDPRFKLIASSQVLEYSKTSLAGNIFSLEAPEQPIPVKKQEKYNSVRWAVSGRSNALNNAKCYHIYYDLKKLESYVCRSARVPKKIKKFILSSWKTLIYLFGSDFRTSITSNRYRKFRRLLDILQKRINRKCSLMISKPKNVNFMLVNPYRGAWNGQPLVLNIRFKKNRFFGKPRIVLNRKRILSQIEVNSSYENGSIKDTAVVLKPQLKSGERLNCMLKDGDSKRSRDFKQSNEERFETDTVALSLIKSKGCAVRTLHFKGISKKSLIGTLPHGYFEDIEFGADFYSGHIIISGLFKNKITDLNRSQIFTPLHGEDFPIRIPIICKVPIACGELTKIYYVYRSSPRVDLDYFLKLKRLQNVSFRLGIATVNPDAFNREHLRFTTVNGGYKKEEFLTKNKAIKHHEPVSLQVSSSHCLGATEGWVSIADKENGIAVIAKKDTFSSVPMIHYQGVDNKYFLRIYNSIGELDDTTDVLLKGEKRVSFSFIGYKKNFRSIRNTATRITQGLIIR